MQPKVFFLVLSIGIILLNLLPQTEAGRDFYQILGVGRDATTKQIKKAYRDLSLKWHPDKNKGSADASKKFSEISEAYDILSDDEKRRIYDQMGEDGLKAGGQQQRNPFDIFSNFGFNTQNNQPEERRGPGLEVPLEVTLEELYNGVELDVFHKKQILCPKCRGTGAKNHDDVATCPDCKGSGTKVYTQQFGPGFYTQTQRTCDKCNGKGKVLKSTCPFCKGKKTSVNHDEHAHNHDLFHDEDDALKVVVEKGMKDGDVIKFERAADQYPDVNPGDVVFKVFSAPHRRFVRSTSNPDNLHMKMNVTLLEALVGFERKFKHLDGHEVHITRQDITSPGHIMTVSGEGMPIHGDSSSFGNLYIELSVVMPKQLTETQKKQIREILPA